MGDIAVKQVVHSLKDGQLSVRDVPYPVLARGDVLVLTAASIISSGTERSMLDIGRMSLIGKARHRPDLVKKTLEKAKRDGLSATVGAVRGRLDELAPIGYSSAGIVLSVGSDVSEFAPGDAVACAGAGKANHAEVVAVPRNLVAKHPRGSLEAGSVAFEEAAFTTIGAIAVQGTRVAEVQMGETVAVVGLGLIGLLTAQLLSATGCVVYGMDPNPARCDLAETLGCDFVATTSEQFKETLFSSTPHGADAVIITAGTASSEPVELAGETSREKGRVVAVGATGLKIPRREYYEKELQVRLSRSYGPGRYDASYEDAGIDYPYAYVRWTAQRNMEAFLSLLDRGRIRVAPLISHRFDIDQALEAYDLISGESSGSALGVVLRYPRALQRVGDAAPDRRPAPGAASTLTASAVPMQSLHLGVIGAGSFAKSVLIPRIRQVAGIELVSVCTSSGITAQSVADKFGFKSSTTDAQAIMDDPTIDAIVIATRHDLHAELVGRALRAGKHVFVEKPLAINEDQLLSLLGTIDDASARLIMVGFNRRFSPMTARLKDFFSKRSGPLAIDYRVNAGFVPAGDWVNDHSVGGGRIVGEACHFIDWISYVVGQPAEVTNVRPLATHGRYRAEENLVVDMGFGDGSLASLRYLANGDPGLPKERIEVFGGGSVAVIDDFKTGWLAHSGKKERLGSGMLSKQEKGHYQELDAFFSALKAGKPSPVPLSDAVSVTRATFAIMDRLRAGPPPVGLVTGS